MKHRKVKAVLSLCGAIPKSATLPTDIDAKSYYCIAKFLQQSAFANYCKIPLLSIIEIRTVLSFVIVDYN